MSVLVSRAYINSNFPVRPTGTSDTNAGLIANSEWIVTNYHVVVSGVVSPGRCPGDDQLSLEQPSLLTSTPTVVNSTTVNAGGTSVTFPITYPEIGICLSTTNTSPGITDTKIIQYTNETIYSQVTWSGNLSYTFTPGILYYLRFYVMFNGLPFYGSSTVTVNTASATTTTTSTTIAPVLIVATSSAMVETFNPYQLWARVYYTIDKDAYSYPYFTANHGINYTDFPTVPTILSPREWAGLMTYPGYDNDAFRYLNYSQLFPVINGNSYYVSGMVNLVNTENISDSTYYLSDYIYVHATSTPTTTTTSTAAPTTTTTTVAPTTTTTSTTLPPLPSITTATITSITSYSGTGGGTASGTVDQKGICWNRTGTPTLQNADAYSSNGAGAGTFSSDVSCVPNTTYYVRAYATNAAGTVYGNQVSFTSLPLPTTTTTTTNRGPGYYACTYDACMYYSSDPGISCSACTPTYYGFSAYQASYAGDLCNYSPDRTVTIYSTINNDYLRNGAQYYNSNGTQYSDPFGGYTANSLAYDYGTFTNGVWYFSGSC